MPLLIVNAVSAISTFGARHTHNAVAVRGRALPYPARCTVTMILFYVGYLQTGISHARRVIPYESARLSFDVSILNIVLRGEGCFLSTTTPAITERHICISRPPCSIFGFRWVSVSPTVMSMDELTRLSLSLAFSEKVLRVEIGLLAASTVTIAVRD